VGRRGSFTDKCRELGLNPALIRDRIRRGRTFDEAAAMGSLPLSRTESIQRAQKVLAHLRPRAAKIRAAGLNYHTIITRMRRYNCSVEEAIAMGPRIPSRTPDPHLSWAFTEAAKNGIDSGTVMGRLRSGHSVEQAITMPLFSGPTIKFKAQQAGVSSSMIYHRMKKHRCTFEEAVAMGPSRLLGSLSAKAKKVGLGVGMIRGRMRTHHCSAEEAIAMGPSRRLLDSLAAKVRRAGLTMSAVGCRLWRGWTLDRALSTPMTTLDPLTVRARAKGLSPRVVRERVNRYGWSEHRALNTPIGTHRARRHRDRHRAAQGLRDDRRLVADHEQEREYHNGAHAHNERDTAPSHVHRVRFIQRVPPTG
jgi:hypothetical protein